jgi:alpha-ketoglutarate-dependent taurine dioxygenase
MLLSDGLIIIKNANLTVDKFEEIAHSLGKPLTTFKHVINKQGTVQELSASELFGTDELDWHNDLSYTTGSFYGSILYNHKNAQLAETWFMDMAALPKEFYEEFKDTVGEYCPPEEYISCFNERQQAILKKQKISRPFVFTRPESTSTVLYCSPGTINNKDVDLSKVVAYAEQHSYKHKWEDDDLLIWDNLRMMHKRLAFSGDRVLWRTQFRI